MSKGKDKHRVRSVKENLWRMIEKETDKLQHLISEEKKRKQVA